MAGNTLPRRFRFQHQDRAVGLAEDAISVSGDEPGVEGGMGGGAENNHVGGVVFGVGKDRFRRLTIGDFARSVGLAEGFDRQ